MVTNGELITEYQRGQCFYSELKANEAYTASLGNLSCGTDSRNLEVLLFAVKFQIPLDVDKTSDKLYRCLTKMLGDFDAFVGPRVSAGADRIVEVGTTQTLIAIITVGSAAITSILWTQLSGSEVTLAGENTDTLIISDLVIDDYLFKVVTTDANGMKASDMMVISAIASTDESEIRTTPVYLSTASTDLYSILVPELIDCDLSFFTAHRGASLTFGGSTGAPTDSTVQVNTTTGLVTFKQEFNPDFPEELWFDYKTSGI